LKLSALSIVGAGGAAGRSTSATGGSPPAEVVATGADVALLELSEGVGLAAAEAPGPPVTLEGAAAGAGAIEAGTTGVATGAGTGIATGAGAGVATVGVAAGAATAGAAGIGGIAHGAITTVTGDAGAGAAGAGTDTDCATGCGAADVGALAGATEGA
jgi:hypothetical protein